MTLLAVLLLSTAGTALLATAVVGLRRPAAPAPDPVSTVCGMPNPDGSLTCLEPAGEHGWHSNGDESWYGDVWNLDHYADTQAGMTAPGEMAGAATENLRTTVVDRPTPTRSWIEFSRGIERHDRIPLAVVGAALVAAAVGLITSAAVVTSQPPTPSLPAAPAGTACWHHDGPGGPVVLSWCPGATTAGDSEHPVR
ncbi:hypothetical protein [Mycolicibacterium sphagni]|uniref:hypothetical protein n=1 Tax=Mycolicibacterium sphagni TaxID=1786 RepID=UPI0021F33FA9|nr:hypothetical protein [Mycolicibacterium sphagni]MCV7174900.1 hypothetical protein [Mycolicibacterium sphagni]